jgi:hypothetical protein
MDLCMFDCVDVCMFSCDKYLRWVSMNNIL